MTKNVTSRIPIFCVVIGGMMTCWLQLQVGQLPLALIFVAEGSKNSAVGISAALNGVGTLVGAFPAGLLLDRGHVKRWVLLLVSVVGVVLLTVLNTVGLFLASVPMLNVGQVIGGALGGWTSTITLTLLTECTLIGSNRSRWFSVDSFSRNLGFILSPLLALVLFLVNGDRWTVAIVRETLLYLVPAMILPLAALTPLVRVLSRTPITALVANESAGGEKIEIVEEIEIEELCSDEQKSDVALAPTIDDKGDVDAIPEVFGATSKPSTSGPGSTCLRLITSNAGLLVSFDIVTSIGAGMTVRFFDLFFLDEHGLSPTSLSILTVAYFGMVVLLLFTLSRWILVHVSPMKAFLVVWSLAILCLVLMSVVQWLPALLVLHVVRGSLANLSNPLCRSMTMDEVPDKWRGRLTALSQIMVFGWSLSAFLGGFLVDLLNYQGTFLFTAALYTVSLVPMIIAARRGVGMNVPLKI